MTEYRITWPASGYVSVTAPSREQALAEARRTFRQLAQCGDPAVHADDPGVVFWLDSEGVPTIVDESELEAKPNA